jgi:hypothetical protein
MLAFFILADYLFMALGTIDEAESLGMGKRPDIVVAIDTLQPLVNGGTKLLIIHVEGKLPLLYLLLARGRNDHLEPLFPALLEDCPSPVTFETCLILYGKGHAGP